MTEEDPIVAEVRRAREQILAEFDYDLRAYVADVIKRQEASGRAYVTLPPRRPVGWQASAAPEPEKRAG